MKTTIEKDALLLTPEAEKPYDHFILGMIVGQQKTSVRLTFVSDTDNPDEEVSSLAIPLPDLIQILTKPNGTK